MQSIPTRLVVLIIVAVLGASLVLTVIAQLIFQLQLEEGLILAESFSFWKIGGIVLSLYAMTTPWRWQKGILSYSSNSDGSATRRLRGMIILFCYIPLVAPLLFGLVLLFQGLSITEFYYFVAISVVGVLGWAIYNLRSMV